MLLHSLALGRHKYNHETMLSTRAFDHYGHMVETVIPFYQNKSACGIYPYMLRSVCQPKTTTSVGKPLEKQKSIISDGKPQVPVLRAWNGIRQKETKARKRGLKETCTKKKS